MLERTSTDWAEARNTIFALYSELNILEDERHALQQAITGESSLKRMSDPQHKRMIDVLRYLSDFKPNVAQAKLENILESGSVHEALPSASEPGPDLNEFRATVSLKEGDEQTLVSVDIRGDIELTIWDDAGEPQKTMRLELKDGRPQLSVWGSAGKDTAEPNVIIS